MNPGRSTSGQGSPGHGPGCYACTDPAGAARQIVLERADLDEEAEAARQLREAGERLRARYPTPSHLSAEDWEAVEFVVSTRLEIANVAACNVRSARAQLDRVVAAHPRVREALEAMQDESRAAGQGAAAAGGR